MDPQNKEDFAAIDDNKKIAVLAHLELSVNRGIFTGIYLLSEDASIVQKEEAPNLSMNLEALRSTLINATKVYPQLSELTLNYQDQMVVVRPAKSMASKGEVASIPGITYLAFIFPPKKAYRKDVNDFIRNLFAPFIIREKKAAPKKKEMEETTKKRFAEDILKDLDKI